MTTLPIPDPVGEEAYENPEALGLNTFNFSRVEKPSPGDVVIDVDMVASVLTDNDTSTIQFTHLLVTDDGWTPTPVLSVELNSAPIDYDIKSLRTVVMSPPIQEGFLSDQQQVDAAEQPTGQELQDRLGCQVAYFDENGTVHMVVVEFFRRYYAAGDMYFDGLRVQRAYAPAPDEGGLSLYPHHVACAFDPEWRISIALIGYTDSPERFVGDFGATYKWTISRVFDAHGDNDREEEGNLELLWKDDHPNVYPAGIVWADDNQFVATVVNLGEVYPDHFDNPGTAGSAKSRIYSMRWYSERYSTMDGVAGVGFADWYDENLNELTEWEYFFPLATHNSSRRSDIYLRQLSADTTSSRQIAGPIATVQGSANWRPTGLFCVRWYDPPPIDPLVEDATTGLSAQDIMFLMSYGADSTLLERALLSQQYASNKILVTVSIPDQPTGVEEEPSHPSYMIMVDMIAQLDEETVGIGVIGAPRDLGIGDVRRINVIPPTLVWAVMQQYYDPVLEANPTPNSPKYLQPFDDPPDPE